MKFDWREWVIIYLIFLASFVFGFLIGSKPKDNPEFRIRLPANVFMSNVIVHADSDGIGLEIKGRKAVSIKGNGVDKTIFYVGPMVKSEDTTDLKSVGETHKGSSPFRPKTQYFGKSDTLHLNDTLRVYNFFSYEKPIRLLINGKIKTLPPPTKIYIVNVKEEK